MAERNPVDPRTLAGVSPTEVVSGDTLTTVPDHGDPGPDRRQQPQVASVDDVAKVDELLGDSRLPTGDNVVAGGDLLSPTVDYVRTLTYCYWLGALPDLPMAYVNVGGFATFQKLTERLTRDPSQGQQTIRTPYPGCLAYLTRSDVEEIARRLPFLGVRWTRRAGSVGPNGTEPGDVPLAGAVNIGKPNQRAVGHVIPYTSPEQVERHKREVRDGERRFMPKASTPRPDDVPLATLIYCVPVLDTERRWEGDDLPPPLSETGLAVPTDEWPHQPRPIADGIVRDQDYGALR